MLLVVAVQLPCIVPLQVLLLQLLQPMQCLLTLG
jgi:hypothetical protein